MPEANMPEANRMPEANMPEANRMPKANMPEANRMPKANMPEANRMPKANIGEIRFWRHLADIGIFESKLGAWRAQILFLGSKG